MLTLPDIEAHIDGLNDALKKAEAKIDFISSNLNIIGSNANVFANSIFNTSNVTGMYNYLKQSSNTLRTVTVPPP